MTAFTDDLLMNLLLSDNARRQVYHHDATYHAEWTMLSRALDRAHSALLAQGDEQADDIATVLARDLPDTTAAKQRIEDAWRRAAQLAGP